MQHACTRCLWTSPPPISLLLPPQRCPLWNAGRRRLLIVDPLHRGRRIYGLTLSASAVRDMVVKWAAHAQVAIDRPTTFGAPSPVTCSTTMWIV